MIGSILPFDFSLLYIFSRITFVFSSIYITSTSVPPQYELSYTPVHIAVPICVISVDLHTYPHTFTGVYIKGRTSVLKLKYGDPLGSWLGQGVKNCIGRTKANT